MDSQSVRKHFGPKQVRTLRGLKIGTVLYECSNFGKKTTRVLVKITGEPYRNHIGTIVDCERSDDGGKTWEPSLIGLGDHNVVPYQSGAWNQFYWLERL